MDTVEPMIEYRDIPNFPGYRVGSDGSVWSSKAYRGYPQNTWHQLVIHTKKNDYQVVNLWHEGHVVRRSLHLLVLESFVGPRPEGMWGLHKNDLRHDNHLANLYWGTPGDHIRDKLHNKR